MEMYQKPLRKSLFLDAIPRHVKHQVFLRENMLLEHHKKHQGNPYKHCRFLTILRPLSRKDMEKVSETITKITIS